MARDGIVLIRTLTERQRLTADTDITASRDVTRPVVLLDPVVTTAPAGAAGISARREVIGYGAARAGFIQRDVWRQVRNIVNGDVEVRSGRITVLVDNREVERLRLIATDARRRGVAVIAGREVEHQFAERGVHVERAAVDGVGRAIIIRDVARTVVEGVDRAANRDRLQATAVPRTVRAEMFTGENVAIHRVRRDGRIRRQRRAASDADVMNVAIIRESNRRDDGICGGRAKLDAVDGDVLRGQERLPGRLIA